jgi:cytochrome bd-type quinol oxidase subunit 2
MTAGEAFGQRRSGWSSAGRAAVFWVTAALGTSAAFATWFLLYLASDVDNRLSADDFSHPNEGALSLGLPVVVVAHAIGFCVLLLTARRARRDRRSAWWFATAALIASSLVGMAALTPLTDGHLLMPYPLPFVP